MLANFNIKNLTVFSEARLELSPGLNVFIGENGSGKTHVLKAAYSAIAASYEEGRKPNAGEPTKATMQKLYAQKLIGVFRPNALGRLSRRKPGRERCELEFLFSEEALNCGFSFATNSKSEVQVDRLPATWQKTPPVYLPTRELLTIYPGFVSVYDNHYLEFDETYRDTCVLLGAPALKGPRAKKSSSLLDPIEDAMRGKVFIDNDGRFFISIPGQGNMEISLVAEGLRKLAMLARLIGTGTLLEEGYLFWDEPEANLNPKLIKLVARVILHLCKNGIQVFLATHSLFFLRELEILSEEKAFKKLKTRYISLAFGESGVEVEQGDSANDLNSLVLLDESLEQSDRYLDLGE